jgi:FkbM family methyltransferase
MGATPSLPPYVDADTAVGRMLLPAGDEVVTKAIVAEGSWEAVESAALMALLRPGATFVDVGAHAGYMTLLGAARVGAGGDVLAVEAHPGNFALLRENIERNGQGQVRAVHAAAWDSSGGMRTVTVSQENSGDHRAFRRADAMDTIEVPSTAIDDLVGDARQIEVVKIDTQGTDHVVVRGMRKTLARCRPVLLVEFWPEGIEEFGDEPGEVLASYRRIGYDIAVLEAPGLRSDSSLESIVQRALACPGAYCTLLLTPAEPQRSGFKPDVVGALLTRVSQLARQWSRAA